jgi:hypothetical protein
MPETTGPTEAELRFYYNGLYTVLRRYRRMTVLGWAIVFLGAASIPLSWRLGTPHGLVDTILSIATIVAGLAMVQHSVASLTDYLHVPFSERPDGLSTPDHPALQYIDGMMRDIDDGGWQEAFAAIGRLEEMETSYNLPPLKSPS